LGYLVLAGRGFFFMIWFFIVGSLMIFIVESLFQSLSLLICLFLTAQCNLLWFHIYKFIPISNNYPYIYLVFNVVIVYFCGVYLVSYIFVSYNQIKNHKKYWTRLSLWLRSQSWLVNFSWLKIEFYNLFLFTF